MYSQLSEVGTGYLSTDLTRFPSGGMWRYVAVGRNRGSAMSFFLCHDHPFSLLQYVLLCLYLGVRVSGEFFGSAPRDYGRR
jgi:hypothetical protein